MKSMAHRITGRIANERNARVDKSILVEDDPVSSEIAHAFRNAEDEEFEDGMESQFARNLSSLVERHGDGAIEGIGKLIVDGNWGSLVAAEALGCLGRMENPATRLRRRNVLQEALNSPSIVVRDAAVLGLAEVNDFWHSG